MDAQVPSIQEICFEKGVGANLQSFQAPRCRDGVIKSQRPASNTEAPREAPHFQATRK